MAGVSFVSATVDIGEVEKGLAAMERRARALSPAFASLKKPMRADQRDHARRQRSPFGTWARRAPSTIAAYRKRRKRVPRPLGRLPTAIKLMSNAWSVIAESRARWSEAHQSGAVVGHGVRLKARPFLWLSRSFLDAAERALAEPVLKAFGGAR